MPSPGSRWNLCHPLGPCQPIWAGIQELTGLRKTSGLTRTGRAGAAAPLSPQHPHAQSSPGVPTALISQPRTAFGVFLGWTLKEESLGTLRGPDGWQLLRGGFVGTRFSGEGSRFFQEGAGTSQAVLCFSSSSMGAAEGAETPRAHRGETGLENPRGESPAPPGRDSGAAAALGSPCRAL